MSGYSTLYIVPKEEFLRYKGVKRGTTLPAVKTLKVQQLNFNEAENITNKVGCESGGKKMVARKRNKMSLFHLKTIVAASAPNRGEIGEHQLWLEMKTIFPDRLIYLLLYRQLSLWSKINQI
jgi:hypothetical protein